jgi:hypothetical protein
VHYNIIAAGKGLLMAKGVATTSNDPPRAARDALGRTIMTHDDMQKFGKDGMDAAMNSFGAWSKSAQAIAVELADYTRKSAEQSAAAWEKLLGAKSLENAIEVQSAYLKSSYEGFVAEATKLGQLYGDLAKEAYKPLEGVLGKASARI